MECRVLSGVLIVGCDLVVLKGLLDFIIRAHAYRMRCGFQMVSPMLHSLSYGQYLCESDVNTGISEEWPPTNRNLPVISVRGDSADPVQIFRSHLTCVESRLSCHI